MKRMLALVTVALCTACASNSGPVQSTARLDGDPEVAMVIRVANLGAVREAELARTRAGSAAVKDFANMMVNEHTAAEDKAETALLKAELPFKDSDLSRQLDAESGNAAQSLSILNGADFDRAYLDRQIQALQKVLDTTDSTLVPRARHKALKQVLTELRTTMQQHLEKAKQVRAGLK
jgi:putative membrane protein